MSPADAALKEGVKAGLTVAESSVLGALSIVCLAMAIASIWLNYKTQNARVDDQKSMADKMEALVREQGQFNTTTTAAIQKLNEHEKAQFTLLTGIHGQLQTIIQGLMKGRG